MDKGTIQRIPLCTVRACPRDGEQWVNRLKEEYNALIQFIRINQENANDWFTVQSNRQGTKWSGKCSFVCNMLRYEFDYNFEIPATYPAVSPDICIPELEGKTVKMYRGGKICLTSHFKPLWARNAPRFGLAHAIALGLGPWLATEIPHLVDAGMITHPSAAADPAPATS
eukprot:gnl/Trimastix_PCT/1331.p1 GENE.gnl/Trimastix_PCT/1331~~gnl/Trimastix_PCT/1331.p1  ORF type:complete len:193 (+),score=23.98 gnl/Trimastix_PCT/1331:70-579(+)